MSRIDQKVWQGKPIILFAATPGPRAGAGVLGDLQRLTPFFGGEVIASVGIGEWQKAWDAEAETLTRPVHKIAMRHALTALVDDVRAKGREDEILA